MDKISNILRNLVVILILGLLIFEFDLLTPSQPPDLEETVSFIITVTNEEYFTNEDSIYQNIVKNRKETFDQADAWDDGSFFVRFGNNVVIYDENGTYSHTLIINVTYGTTVYCGAIGNDEIELIASRCRNYLRINKNGEEIDSDYLSFEEYDEKKDELAELNRGLYETKAFYLGDNNQLVLELPPYFTAPTLENSYIKIYSSDASDAECIYNDDGLCVLIQYFDMTFAVVIILAIVILIKKRH